MSRYFVFLRGWKVDSKTFLNIMCLFFVFFFFPNKVWGEIIIIGDGTIKPIAEWFLPPAPEPLALGKLRTFKATASRGNPHPIETPGVVIGEQEETPGVKQDPKLGYIKFSATGDAKLSMFSKDEKKCGLFCGNELTHSVKYKWNKSGIHTVTAKIFDEDGRERDSVSWSVPVGDLGDINQILEEMNKPRAEIIIQKAVARKQRIPPLTKPVYVWHPKDQIELIVGQSFHFEVKATCEDGIDSIEFSSHNPNRCRSFIGCKTHSAIKKYTFKNPGRHTVTATVTSKKGVREIITWTVNVVPKSPDLTVWISRVGKRTVSPGEGFKLNATVQNRGYAQSLPTKLRFYSVSDSRNVPTSDTLLLSEGHFVRALKVGEKTEISLPLRYFTAPNTPGTYYYGACVDAVKNESDTNNNCSDAIAIIVRSSDRPDLVVESSRVNKSSLAPGEGFTLSTTVRNAGTGRSTATRLRCYQSADASISTNDTQIGIADVGALSSGVTRNKSFRITAPNVPGTYYYGVCVDGVQNESGTTNNCSQAIAITVQAPILPDLAIESISASSNVVGPGENFTLFVTVRNQGTGASRPTTLSYHDPNGGQIGTDRIGRLSPSAVSRQSISLRAPDRTGTYYYDACVESPLRDDESNLDNNCSVELAITVGTPANRVPVAVGTIPAQTLVAGASRQINVSIYFRDTDGDRLTYRALSDNANIATARASGDIVTITPLRVGNTAVSVTASDGRLTATQRVFVTVSDTPQQNQSPRTVGTIANRSMTQVAGATLGVSGYFRDPDGETLTYTARSYNTNVVTVSIAGAYLTLNPVGAGSANVSVTASDGSATATQHFSVRVGSVPTQNQTPRTVGTIPTRSMTMGAAGAIQVSGYFSDPDGDSLTYTARSDNTSVVTTFVSGDYLNLTPVGAGNASVSVTASDGSSTATQRFTVTVASQVLDVPDLVVESTRVSKNRVAPGESFKFYATVRNQGTDPANRTTLRYYRSVDSTISKSDVEEDSDSIRQSLNPDETSEEWDSLRVPNTPGIYYYGVCVDSVPDESNTNNNCSDAIAVTVYAPGPPDLIVENPRVSKSTVGPGEDFRFYATVRNQGTGDADSTTLYYNRSNDSNISENDPNERWDSVSSLDPDETDDEWATLTAPNTPGIYYYGACVGSVTNENNTNNNCSNAIRITVQRSSPDLVVESVRVSDATLDPGDSFKFYATVRNQGSGDADRTTLRYYRSTDSHISTSDTQVDTDSVTSLDPNEDDEEWDRLTAPNTPGTYYYGACVDSVTDESNTGNNCSTAIRITVQGTQPPPGLGIGDSIFAQNTVGGGFNGLRVRSGAGTGFDQIGGVWDGATGTITDGPRTANGYTWWKIRWNASNKVECDENPCEGWSVEIFNGTRVIAKPGLAAPVLNAMTPMETTLLTNYPNPFNPETWIPYRLSEASDVTVRIYSVNGQLIRTLDLGHQAAGIYQSKSRAAYWDGRNEFGERVASGLYFYTFTAGDFTATRKMLIRK